MPSISKTNFRLLICTYILLLAASSITAIYWPGCSDEFSAALDKEAVQFYTSTNLLFNIALGVCAILSVIGIIGLVLFKSWGRALSLYATIGGVILLAFLGPTLSSGIGGALYELSTLVWGAVIGLSYFSSISDLFSDKTTYATAKGLDHL